MNLLKYIVGLAFVTSLAACGGGGGNSSAPVPTTPPTGGGDVIVQIPESVELLTSTNTLQSAGSEAVITAFVKDSGNVGLAGQKVTFSASSGTLQLISGVTDPTGSASAKLFAGSDKSIRDITVTATAVNVAGSIIVPVTGTKISVVGVGSLQAGGAASQFTVRAVDSSGNGINNATLIVKSSLNNGLSSSAIRSDASGAAAFLYTPNNAGTDIVSVSGLGANSEINVVVNAIDFTVISPVSNTFIPIGSNQKITFQYRLSGVAQKNQPITFSTTRGTLASAAALTDGIGQATVDISSTTSGPTNVVAQIAGVGSVSVPLQFVATTPSSIVVQANPGGVLPNVTGSVNQSTIEALVRDVNGNAVANRQVNFTVLKDLSNGQLSAGNALTDSNGRVQVQFIPGATSTPSNGVEIQAEVASTLIKKSTYLTVNGNALFITIGFGNTISDLDLTSYSKIFSVYVTDANGVAVGNQLVSLSVIPTDYYKGVLEKNEDGFWVKQATAICANEDAKFGSGASGYLDGILDAGEDTNGDKRLTPGNVAVAAPGSVSTDSNGRATFEIQYGKQFAPWVKVDIAARAIVSGTESKQSISYILSGSIADFKLEGGPAGVVSPYGFSGNCDDAL